MIKHKRMIAIALAAGLGIGASGAALGQGGMGPGMMGGSQQGMGPGMMGSGHHGMGPGMMMGGGMDGMMPCPMMAEGMGMMSMLDDDQRSEMRELMQEHRPAQFERMGEMMDLRMELMGVMHADSPDPEEVQALHARMGELRGEMMAEMVRMRGNMLDLLTDDQREQLKQGAATPR